MNESNHKHKNTIKFSTVLKKTLKSLFYPQVILVFLIPFFVSLFLTVLIFYFSIDTVQKIFVEGSTSAVQMIWSYFVAELPSLVSLMPFFNFVSEWVAIVLLIALSIPLFIALNLMFVSLISSSYLVQVIAKKDYENLKPEGHSRWARGLFNTLGSTLIYLVLWMITLPLWLIPGAAFVIPMLLTAWLNRRICSFDALTEFSSNEELKTQLIVTKDQGLMLGLILAALNLVPLAFFITPVVSMIAFAHLNLGLLEKSRAG